MTRMKEVSEEEDKSYPERYSVDDQQEVVQVAQVEMKSASMTCTLSDRRKIEQALANKVLNISPTFKLHQHGTGAPP